MFRGFDFKSWIEHSCNQDHMFEVWSFTYCREACSPATRRFEDCPHANTDNRGSTKTTHRVYCLDCHNVVDQIPQAEYRAKLAVAEQVKSSDINTSALFARVVRPSQLSVFSSQSSFGPISQDAVQELS